MVCSFVGDVRFRPTAVSASAHLNFATNGHSTGKNSLAALTTAQARIMGAQIVGREGSKTILEVALNLLSAIRNRLESSNGRHATLLSQSTRGSVLVPAIPVPWAVA